jgi:hypothetical protein
MTTDATPSLDMNALLRRDHDAAAAARAARLFGQPAEETDQPTDADSEDGQS